MKLKHQMQITEHATRNTSHASRITLPCLLLAILLTPSAFPQVADDKNATFFMGRIRYSSSEGNDCPGVGQDLMKLVSRASTIKVQEERRIKLTDAELYETPFLFMNGHNDFVFTEAEIANLRHYLSRGGFFFASGCCTNPKQCGGTCDIEEVFTVVTEIGSVPAGQFVYTLEFSGCDACGASATSRRSCRSFSQAAAAASMSSR